MLLNEGSLKLQVANIDIKGKEHFSEIPANAKIVVVSTHLTDVDMQLAIEAVGHDMDLAITNQSLLHEFRTSPDMYAAMKISGKGNFIPVDYERVKVKEKDNEGKEKTVKKSVPGPFNPDNFVPAMEALEKGKSVLVAAHNSSSEVQDIDSLHGGYGAVYLALSTGAYILPVASRLDRADAGMSKDQVKNLMNRPNAEVVIGKPFQLEKIPGIEHYSELLKKRKELAENGAVLAPEEFEEFSRIGRILREQSRMVIEKLREQLPPAPEDQSA